MHPHHKRKRASIDPEIAHDVAGCLDDPKARNGATSLPTTNHRRPILQELTVVVSTRQSPPTVTDPKEEESSRHPHSYKSLTSLVGALGAKVTAQVHAKVHCVIATNEALAGPSPTQRVRQAWRRGIPVVTLTWLTECQVQQTLLPCTDYLVAPPSPLCSPRTTRTLNKDITSSIDATVQEDATISSLVTERVLDLGCCCACHDDDAAAATSICEWCVDCSVNRAKHLVTEKVLDLGCCCSCHDDDTAKNCEWCVDCSVNVAKNLVEASFTS